MSSRQRDAQRRGRLVGGGVGVVLLLALGGTFLLSGSARDRAETDAQVKAQTFATSEVMPLMTPELLSGDLEGQVYRDLLASTQAAILSESNIVRVRVWRPGGALVFSTEARDEVGDFTATGNRQIASASDGNTVSLLDEAGPPPAGLEGSEEDLFATYVPLRFSSSAEPSGAIEVDQRYASIDEEANRVWRPVQIGLAVALVGLGVLFGISQRPSRARSARLGPRPPRVSRDERTLRDAEDRALAAERAARTAEERLADAERRVEELTKAEVPPQVRSRLEELELQVRAETADREQLAAESKRLRTALSEKEAQLALARDGTAITEADRARSIDAITRAERQTAEAERRAVSAGSLAAAAEGRAVEAEAKVVRLEAQLLDAEHRIADAVADAGKAGERARADEDARSAAELRAAQLEANDLKLAVAEAQTALRESEARRAAGEGALVDLDRVRGEADTARTELDVTKLELQRTKLELETARDELETSMSELTAARTELAGSRTELERVTSDYERVSTDHERVTADYERVHGELEARVAAAGDATAGLESTTAELESTRAGLASTTTELDTTRDELASTTAELESTRAELETTRAELERRGAAVDAGSETAAASDEETAELRSRLTQIEAQRRDEVSELQRAQESLANTQVELMDATRRLRTAEARIDELEAVAGDAAPARPGEIYEPVPSEEPRWTEEEPVAEPRKPARRAPKARPEEPKAEPEEPEGADEPEMPEVSEEGLSLRERLARAAAARHRTIQPPD